MHQREISGDSYPYGLQLILSSLSTATHRGDPIELLDIDPVLKRLKEEIQDPSFIPDLIKEYLLDNPHKVVLTVKPDAALSSKQNNAEVEKLAAIKAGLSDTEKQAIVEQSQALEDRQNQDDDASILPKVELSDVPTEIKWPESATSSIQSNTDALKTSFFPQGTNGLSYQQIIVELPELSDSQKNIMPYYASCLPELGLGKRSYLDIQGLQASISGGINAHTSMRSSVDSEQELQGYMILSSKSLYSQQEQLGQLMYDTLYSCRFDEHQRIKEIVEQICCHKEQSITSQGHALAMGLATSKMSPISSFNYGYSGLLGIKNLKLLCKDLEDERKLADFAAQFGDLHDTILQGNKQFLLISEAAEQANLNKNLQNIWQNAPSAASSLSQFSLPKMRESVREAWLTSTQVNFCASAFPTVSVSHEDSAALTVLGGFLRNGYLHRAIREQGGAYGGGASQDSSSASFRFFSYRDPRLSETLNDFEKSIDWLNNNKHQYSQLEEAILGVISSLDKPASPAGTAKQAYFNELFGRSKEQRNEFRQRVLDVSIEKLQQVSEKYLSPEKASIGIESNKAAQAELEKLELSIKYL